MSEYVISDEVSTSLAVNLETGSWRVIGLPVKRYFFEWDTGQLLASFGGSVYLLEDDAAQPLTDGDTPVTWQVQTPTYRTDIAQKGTVSMVFVEINTRGQVVIASLVVDEDTEGDPNLLVLGALSTPKRDTVELPIADAALQGRTFAVRLDGQLTQRVDLFGIEMDIEVPDPMRQ